MTTNEELDAGIAHWEALAEAQVRLEAIDTQAGVWRGGPSNPYQNRAEDYRRAAQALRIQKETGVAVCSCCFKPFGQGNGIASRNQ